MPKIPETNGWSTYPPSSIGMNMFTGINSGLGSFTYLVTIMLAGFRPALLYPR
ncbi:MAG: Hypothetical protein AJITA_00620 [Acetilactobacillus jinshanensis]